MYFDFDDRRFETPTVEAAMSWREQALLSIFAHVLVVLAVIFVPQMSFVRDAEARRADRLAELAEEQAALAALQREADTDRPFVFVQPRVDLETLDLPRLDAPLSDRDRRAQSPSSSDDPLNSLPNALGNSSTLAEADDPDAGLDETPRIGVLADANSPDPADVPDPDPAVDELLDALADRPPSESADDPGPGEDREPEERTAEALDAEGSLVVPRQSGGPEDPDPRSDADVKADGLLGRAMANLEQYVRRESFDNQRGSIDQYGPSIQFDTKGVEFGPWVRRFIAQIRRNWFIPYAAFSMHGNVVLTFYVHTDGALTDLTVQRPSAVGAFTNSAFNALQSSNPTQPLPPEYPDDQAFFTVTFYFNESPPA